MTNEAKKRITERFDPNRGYGMKCRRDDRGNPVCRYCGSLVPKPRRTFCSSRCVDEWKIRRSASEVRLQVFRRDKGICAVCGLDTVAAKKKIYDLWDAIDKHIHPSQRDKKQKNIAKHLDIWCDRLRAGSWRRIILRTIWEAHHIHPVIEGGGQCGLDGYATMCSGCHLKETNGLRRRLRKHKERKVGK